MPSGANSTKSLLRGSNEFPPHKSNPNSRQIDFILPVGRGPFHLNKQLQHFQPADLWAVVGAMTRTRSAAHHANTRIGIFFFLLKEIK